MSEQKIELRRPCPFCGGRVEIRWDMAFGRGAGFLEHPFYPGTRDWLCKSLNLTMVSHSSIPELQAQWERGGAQ